MNTDERYELQDLSERLVRRSRLQPIAESELLLEQTGTRFRWRILDHSLPGAEAEKAVLYSSSGAVAMLALKYLKNPACPLSVTGNHVNRWTRIFWRIGWARCNYCERFRLALGPRS